MYSILSEQDSPNKIRPFFDDKHLSVQFLNYFFFIEP